MGWDCKFWIPGYGCAETSFKWHEISASCRSLNDLFRASLSLQLSPATSSSLFYSQENGRYGKKRIGQSFKLGDRRDYLFQVRNEDRARSEDVEGSLTHRYRYRYTQSAQEKEREKGAPSRNTKGKTSCCCCSSSDVLMAGKTYYLETHIEREKKGPWS